MSYEDPANFTTTTTPSISIASTFLNTTTGNTFLGQGNGSTAFNYTNSTSPTFLSNSSSSSNSTDTDHDLMMGPTELVLTVLPLSIISLLIILGNLLVIVAVFSQRSLRTPQNIFIVSLACVDMAVGVFVLPFNISSMVLGRWPFGEVLCKLWLTADVALCSVSIFHLCAIGLDRYRAITDGINYVQRRNLRSVLWTIGGLWLLALWISSPPLLAMHEWRILYDGQSCSFPDNVGYAYHLAIGALFFPLIIMSVIYVKIYYAIKLRLKERARVACIELTSDADTTDRLESEEAETSVDDTLKATEGKSTNTLSVSAKKSRNQRRKPSAQINTFLVNKQKFSLSRERKAARTLGIIMGTFVICWLPLGLLNTIGSLMPPQYRPGERIFHTFTWLGYVNSAVNPIIYAVSNQEFQKAFRRVLRLNN
jgi:5-hydroxytryptamine receptor 1